MREKGSDQIGTQFSYNYVIKRNLKNVIFIIFHNKSTLLFKMNSSSRKNCASFTKNVRTDSIMYLKITSNGSQSNIKNCGIRIIKTDKNCYRGMKRK